VALFDQDNKVLIVGKDYGRAQRNHESQLPEARGPEDED
jgi:hypothetical protein